MGGEVRAGRRERGYGAAVTACTGPDSRLGTKGMRRAHVEHVAHVRDAGGVEAQRLVKRRRALPSRREGRRCGGERWERGGGRACGVWWHDKRGMHGDGPNQGLGAKGTRGAHAKHEERGRDAGGVEAQRLVEGRRLLSSRREGMRCGRERCEPEGRRGPGVWWRHTRGIQKDGPTQGWGPRACAESAPRT